MVEMEVEATVMAAKATVAVAEATMPAEAGSVGAVGWN